MLTLLTWLLLLYIWHRLMYYITQKQNDALCGQSLLCTENVYIMQYTASLLTDCSLKLRWRESHAQVIGYSFSAALQGHAKLCRRGERRLTTLRPYCCRATATNWLIDVIDDVQCLREALLIFSYELLCKFFDRIVFYFCTDTQHRWTCLFSSSVYCCYTLYANALPHCRLRSIT